YARPRALRTTYLPRSRPSSKWRAIVLSGCHSEERCPSLRVFCPCHRQGARASRRVRDRRSRLDHRQKEGNMRPIITTTITATILALTAAVASPAVAQQADSQTKQAVEGIVAKWTQAVNQGDSSAASSLFTADSFTIDVYGKTTTQTGE